MLPLRHHAVVTTNSHLKARFLSSKGCPQPQAAEALSVLQSKLHRWASGQQPRPGGARAERWGQGGPRAHGTEGTGVLQAGARPSAASQGGSTVGGGERAQAHTGRNWKPVLWSGESLHKRSRWSVRSNIPTSGAQVVRGSSPHTWLCPALGQTVRLPISALASRCLAPDPSEGRKVASTAGRPAPSARTGRKGPQPCPASGALSSGCACSRGHLVCTDRFCMNIHAASARTGRWCLRKQNGALSWSPRVTNEGQTLALDAGAFV